MVYVGEKPRLLLARLFEFYVGHRQGFSSLSHLTLQSRISLPKMRGHLVKLFRKNLDLVARLEMKSMTQIAFADPFDTTSQRLKRPNHPSPQKQTRQHRHTEADQEKRRRAQHRSIQRRVGLFRGPLDDNKPLEARDKSVRTDDFLAFEIRGQHHSRSRRARGDFKSPFYLSEMA